MNHPQCDPGDPGPLGLEPAYNSSDRGWWDTFTPEQKARWSWDRFTPEEQAWIRFCQPHRVPTAELPPEPSYLRKLFGFLR